MDVIVVCVGAGMSLALWIVLYRKVNQVLRSVWLLARQGQPNEIANAQVALQEATAAKVGPMVLSLRELVEQITASYRGQIAAAENRARLTDSRSSDAAVALSAASELVRELRALLDQRRAQVVSVAAPAALIADPAERETTEQPKPAPEAVETTRKPDRAAPASRERSSPRHAAPGLEPPGSAMPLSSEPAMKAAGLGPRPTSRPAPKEEPPRRLTLLGIRPPLRPPPLRAPDADDDDRPSDDEVTRVGALPPASALATTLPSMPAVTQPNTGEGGGS